MNILYQPGADASRLVIEVPSGQTAQEYAESQGWTADQWAEFDLSSFDPGAQNFWNAFSLVNNLPSPNTVTFSLPAAKEIGKVQLKGEYTRNLTLASDGYAPEAIASQASLPPESRVPEMDLVISAINVLSVDLSNGLSVISSATSVTEINNLVNPPTGIIFTGRGSGLGPEDLNVSYYVEFNSASLTESETELYVPGTNTVIPYNPELGESGGFDSVGNCFNPGDYLIQIRQVSNSFVIAEFEVPLNPAGENVSF